MIVIGKKVEMTTNVPTDLPDHSGDMPTPILTTPKPAEVPTPKPEPTPAPKVEEKPAAAPPAAAVEPKPVVAPVAETPKPQPQPEAAASAVVSNASPAKVATPPAQPPVETAVTTPQINLFSARNIAIVSVAFTAIVCGLLFMSARNARKASRVSLITRSLDREDK
jgi:outer membrane biosynthesis protein TonB